MSQVISCDRCGGTENVKRQIRFDPRPVPPLHYQIGGGLISFPGATAGPSYPDVCEGCIEKILGEFKHG